uniref:Uncharacterized protein n=1 Tax=Angiostrongylus cantonensis TaxID=6313 RepID=A0A158P6P1_ANGCA
MLKIGEEATEGVMDVGSEASEANALLWFILFEETTAGTMNGSGDGFPITLVETDLSQEYGVPAATVPSVNVSSLMPQISESHSEMESANKVSLRKSVDSDPGDFVKIDGADNGNSSGQTSSPSQTTAPNALDVAAAAQLEDKGEVKTKSADIEQSDEELNETCVMPLQQWPSWVWQVAALVVSCMREESAVVELRFITDMVIF